MVRAISDLLERDAPGNHADRLSSSRSSLRPTISAFLVTDTAIAPAGRATVTKPLAAPRVGLPRRGFLRLRAGCRLHEFDDWLAARGARDREVVLAVYKKGSDKQVVTLEALQEVACTHGWVDTRSSASTRSARRSASCRVGRARRGASAIVS